MGTDETTEALLEPPAAFPRHHAERIARLLETEDMRMQIEPARSLVRRARRGTRSAVRWDGRSRCVVRVMQASFPMREAGRLSSACAVQDYCCHNATCIIEDAAPVVFQCR